ncbi:MAG: protein-export membrane protein SecD [Candidatus Levybacteria bacterium RIFCSPLOWO2_01_FULL_39_10]|nr:MAG: protein-export membrane protein SecD [Candidatus Levybacteria bacterium RIFCSPLOWO2_01_FULL_39_10]
MKSPRFLFFLIIALSLFAVFVTLPESVSFRNITKDNKLNVNILLGKLKLEKELSFRQGLDLQGGISLTFEADLSEIPSTEKESAVDSARNIIERRINIFGVSEPLIQTQKVNDTSRIIVELPGITDVNQAISLIGQTANLTFWEQVATVSTMVATSSAYPINAEFLGVGPIGQTSLTGADLKNSSVTFDQTTGAPVVQLNFDSNGAKKFADITKRNIGKPVAIVLDNIIITAPNVNEEILTGQAVISGSFTQEEAKSLSTQLNAGALPVPLTVLQQRVIGPTLGQQSLQKSLFAGLIGFVTIVAFMIAFYKRLGVIASIALVIYVFLNLAVFKLSSFTPFGITLTLAGIAGFILSIGMAVDANILIFERMKEEGRLGKGKKSSMELGFLHAWTSIRDSNVSTLITCVILYTFGTGIVKGFALVLAIGVLISMFSAITITRTMLRLVYK